MKQSWPRSQMQKINPSSVSWTWSTTHSTTHLQLESRSRKMPGKHRFPWPEFYKAPLSTMNTRPVPSDRPRLTIPWRSAAVPSLMYAGPRFTCENSRAHPLFTAFSIASAPFQLKKLDLLAQHVCACAYLPARTNFDLMMREDDNNLNTLIFLPVK